MAVEVSTLCRVGAWGQLATLVFIGTAWMLEAAMGVLVACVVYLLVTMVGVVGIARTESAIAGPFVFPFLLPGFVPLYYVATQSVSS